MSKILSIVIPTYNEKDNITPLIEKIHSVMSSYNYEILFIDDDSKDGTAEAIHKLEKSFPIRVVVRKDKKGLASAVVDGIDYADSNIVGVMDADLQHPPEILPDLLKAIQNGAEIAIASRYVKGGGCIGWSFTRKIISKGAITIAHLFLPQTKGVHDPMSGFFMLKKAVVEGVELTPTGYKILLEILVKGKYRKLTEVPYQFLTRQKGSSKLSTKTQVDYLKHVYSLMDRRRELIRFVKFCVVGGSGVLVNLGVFWILTRFAGLREADFLALAIGIEASIVSNFTLNEFITFRDRRSPGSNFLTRLLKFNLFCLIGAGIQAGVYALLHHVVGIYDLISNLFGIAAATLWNYLVNVLWTWR